MTKTTLNNIRQKAASHSGIPFQTLLAGLLFMLQGSLLTANAQTSSSPGQYLDFDENKLEIVITPDYFPIIWHHIQKYNIDYTDTTSVISCNMTQQFSTPGGIQYIYIYNCPSAATAAGAVYFKEFNAPGYGTITVYYDSNLEAIGS